MISANNVTYRVGKKALFEDVNIKFTEGNCYGLIGANGAGKSTFLKILSGKLETTKGDIAITPGQRLSVLEQDHFKYDEYPVMDVVIMGNARLYEIMKEKDAIYAKEDFTDEDGIRASELEGEFAEMNGWEAESDAAQLLNGLGIDTSIHYSIMKELNGSEKVKVLLAKALFGNPDILLLDEPTNFLDKEHVTWLAEYLSSLPNAFLVVSHDYDFLEKISTRICDIDNEKITKYFGTYSEFTRKKALLREDYIRQYAAQQKTIKKTEEFIRRNIAGRKSKMARGRQKQLDRMDKMEALEQKEIKPHFRFEALPLTTTEHLKVKHLDVGYHYPVLSDISFSIKGGEKIVMTGFNGIGKSTLLKTLISQIPSLSGSFRFSEQVKIGYFEQELAWADIEKTPIQIVSDAYPSLTIKDVRKRLAGCGISSKHAMQEIGTLSGGEQAKVKMCLLMMKPCNFLIMDEPTNYLDALAKESLKTALEEFEGTVLLVSHEEAFYREWTQKVINIEKKIILHLNG